MTDHTNTGALHISIDVPADPDELDPRVRAAIEELAAALQAQGADGADVQGFAMGTRQFSLDYVTGGSDGPGGGSGYVTGGSDGPGGGSATGAPYFEGLGFTVRLP